VGNIGTKSHAKDLTWITAVGYRAVMPVEFLSDEEAAAFGRFDGASARRESGRLPRAGEGHLPAEVDLFGNERS
jgi:hypothetical protein